ncbi:MAG: lytic polysaccharide monooxygenase [Proteobacteria bacterium]|nr:lytic polysaccharide monooxygenase [Pseudomonadota bacterium]
MKILLRNFALPLALLVTQAASAHFDLDSAGTHKSRYGRKEIKKGPCGRTGGVRGKNVYTYEPGATIQVAIDEFVPHPGYFRIAFQKDGDNEFVNPQTILPINRECLGIAADKCGATDFYNTPNVLLDNLDPHQRGPFNKRYSWDVTLPDVECKNCTLQIIQVMTDEFPIHAPYDPSYSSEDIYYQCIDLVLQKN